MIKAICERLKKNESGTSLVEFAIVVLVLLTLLFGIIEFGWIFNGYITLTAAVREGVRAAVVSEDKNEAVKQNIRQIVRDHAKTFQLADSDIIITFGNYNQETTVEVSEGKLPLLVGFFPFIPNLFEIEAEATMLQER